MAKAKPNQYQLFSTKRFAPFFWTQFLGAFNDNIFKNALVISIAYLSTQQYFSTNTLVNLCSGLFIVPFFLLSAFAGQLADKYEKAQCIRLIKKAEIVIMCLAALGFFFHSVFFLMFILFLMGAQSTFFAPIKYSILPQHLKSTELVGGNGLVEMGTFVAILLGTLFGGVLIGVEPYGNLIVSASLILFAVLGWWTSLGIPKAKPSEPALKISYNLFKQTWKIISVASKHRTVFLSILGNSWFWFYGFLILAQLPNYTKVYLGGNEHVVTLLLFTFCVGVGAGSLLCERLSGHKIELGLIPFGSIGLSIFAVLMYTIYPSPYVGEITGVASFLSHTHNWLLMGNIICLGMFGGFYIVPLFALIQHRSPAENRSRMIACNSIFNALFMVSAAIFAIILLGLGVTIPQLFLITGIINAGVIIALSYMIPEFFLRFITWILICILYRTELDGIEENIPEKGPALLVCNHVSFIDPLVIMASVRRPIRFVMDHNIYHIFGIHFLFKMAKTIPIAPRTESPERKQAAFDKIASCLENGELVAIFPEGGITRDGELQKFKPGVMSILKRTPVPVIPLALRGLWGSFFSRKYGKAMMNLPRRFRSEISLHAAHAIAPQKVDLHALENTVLHLRGLEK